MVRREAFPLSGDAGIGEIRDMVTRDAMPAPTARARRVRHRAAAARRLRGDRVMSFIDPSVIKPFKVVLDAGSGMAGLVAPRLFDRLPCRTTRLCFEIDGTFPNHEANPLIEENRADIVARVVKPTAPTSASRGTATPTAASSSTAPASSSRATSSRRSWPKPP